MRKDSFRERKMQSETLAFKERNRENPTTQRKIKRYNCMKREKERNRKQRDPVRICI